MRKPEFVRKFAHAVTGLGVARPTTRVDAVLLAFAEAKKHGIFVGPDLIGELVGPEENMLVVAIADVYSHSRYSTADMWAVAFLTIENIELAWEYYKDHDSSE